MSERKVRQVLTNDMNTMLGCLLRVLLTVLLALGAAGYGQAEDLSASMDVGQPVAELPKGVSAPAGKVSLIADFASASPGKPVPVYLVNLSGKELSVPSQDGDIYVKLEARAADGQWARAQTHQDSRCGNSYYNLRIKPGCFYPVAGYQPLAFGSRKTQVRYRLYADKAPGEADLATEAAEGTCSESDMEMAKFDDLGLREASFEFLVSVARGNSKPSIYSPDFADAQARAILRLSQSDFAAEKSLPVLKELLPLFPKQEQAIQYAIQSVSQRGK